MRVILASLREDASTLAAEPGDRPLQAMITVGRKPLDRGHVAVTDFSNVRDTGFGRFAIHMHRTVAALPGATAIFGAG